MCRSLTEVNFRILRKIFSLSTSKRPPGTLSPMEKRKTVSRQRSLSKRKLQILVTIHICLFWILETHHQKERIVPQQSVFSREGLALYYPWLVSCSSQKLSLTWHRNCKLGNTSKLFTMTEGLKKLQPLAKGDVVRVLPLPGQSKWFKAQVEDQVVVRSHNVRNEDGRVYRRNRSHLYKVPEKYQAMSDDESVQPETTSRSPMRS